MNATRVEAHRRGVRLRVLALVSDAQSAGDGDRPARGRVKILGAADAFDRRDHAMSAAAYELHVKATLSSAALDHPGFVPDEYLTNPTGEDLASPCTDPAILAAELCSVGMWRRADGGYRVLDWPAVQAAIDHVRELRTVDKPARNRRERPLQVHVSDMIEQIEIDHLTALHEADPVLGTELLKVVTWPVGD